MDGEATQRRQSTTASPAVAGDDDPDLLHHNTLRRFLAQGGRRGQGGAFGSDRFCRGGLYRRRQAAVGARVSGLENRERGGALDLDLGFRCVWHHVREVLNLAKSSLGSRHGYIGGNLAGAIKIILVLDFLLGIFLLKKGFLLGVLDLSLRTSLPAFSLLAHKDTRQ